MAKHGFVNKKKVNAASISYTEDDPPPDDFVFKSFSSRSKLLPKAKRPAGDEFDLNAFNDEEENAGEEEEEEYEFDEEDAEYEGSEEGGGDEEEEAEEGFKYEDLQNFKPTGDKEADAKMNEDFLNYLQKGLADSEPPLRPIPKRSDWGPKLDKDFDETL